MRGAGEADDWGGLIRQQVDSVEGLVRMQTAGSYLDDARVILDRGATDDIGAANYPSRVQNVPDRYVVSLQRHLRALGFDEVGEPDGAFGKGTRRVVLDFQSLAGVAPTGAVDDATKAELARWLDRGLTRHDPPAVADADLATQDGITLIEPRFPHFSQGDPRWADRMLGTGSSIKSQGCAIACIAMVLGFYGRTVDPRIVDEFLDRNEGYLGNLVKWDVAARCAEGAGPVLRHKKTLTGDEPALVATLNERIDRNAPTLVRVDHGSDDDSAFNHFVVCVGRTANGDFVMNDPASSAGDGYARPVADNIIQQTTRKGGYRIVALDCYDPVGG